MFSYLTRLAGLAALAVPLVFAAPAQHLKIRNALTTDVVPDSYIVVYDSDITAAAIKSHVESVAVLISRKRSDTPAGLQTTYDLDDFKGYHVLADSATIATIADSPEVWPNFPFIDFWY